MLERLIAKKINNHFDEQPDKVLVVTGARQAGKSYIIRHVGKKRFKNFIEINLLKDKMSNGLFSNIKTINDFYLAISSVYGHQLDNKENTLIFLDEIQEYPDLLTLFKFLKEDDKYEYIASGSLLGVTLAQTSSIPIGSVRKLEMYQLNFVEFLLANGFNHSSINTLRTFFNEKKN